MLILSVSTLKKVHVTMNRQNFKDACLKLHCLYVAKKLLFLNLRPQIYFCHIAKVRNFANFPKFSYELKVKNN